MVQIKFELSDKAYEDLAHYIVDHGISLRDRGLLIARAVELYIDDTSGDTVLERRIMEISDKRKAAQRAGMEKAWSGKENVARNERRKA
jgi:hypothetical protein